MKNYTNIPNIYLKNIFIGNSDGKTESTKLNFDSFFYKGNNKYQEIMKPDTFIISGRKGCGKTILAYFIQKQSEKEKHWTCKICDLIDFNLQKLIDFDYNEFNEKEITLFWEWVILLELSKLIVTSHTLKSFIPFYHIHRLKRFINTVYKNTEMLPYEATELMTTDTINEETYSQASTALFHINFKAKKNKGINKKFIKNNYYNNLKILNKIFTNAIKKSNNITLIYDDLDDINIKIENNINYQILIKSLIQAVHKINTYIRMNTNNNKTKVIICLRSDIIDSLHKTSVNLNKITSDCEVELNWLLEDSQADFNHPLMDLILTKIKNSTPEYYNFNKEQIYNKLFPEKIEGKSVIKYLLDYSFGRPRDVIKYLNIIIKRYPNSTYFKAKYFKNCKLKFSNWFYNELQNELCIYESPEFIYESLQLIRNMKKIAFDYPYICNYYKNNKYKYPHITSIDYMLQFLYRFSVLGNSWLKENKKKKKSPYKPSDFNYCWCYKTNCENICDLDKYFVIHKGFRKKFLMK